MADVDVSKLKVAELKKLLKDKGLPIGGTKPQLIERLAKAAEGIAGEAEDLNEDLLDEDVDDEDDDEDVDDEDDAAEDAAAEEHLALDESSLAQDGKILAPKDTEKNAEVKEESKENLETVASKDAVTTKPTRIEAPVTAEEPQVQKLADRAKKFGIVSADDQKATRAARFGLPAEVKSTKTSGTKSPPATVVSTADVEKLKSRAERFGTTVSSTYSKVENIDRQRARAERFGCSVSALYAQVEVTDKMKKRAQRFGAITSSTLSKVDEDERILKRKQRFGAVTTTAATDESGSEAKKQKRAQRFNIV